jgi:hypothetical protein
VRASQRRRGKRPLFETDPVSPFASMEYRAGAHRVLGLLALFDLVRSGIRPGPGDPRAWYDRVIRTVGGSLILACLLGGAVVMALRACRGR